MIACVAGRLGWDDVTLFEAALLACCNLYWEAAKVSECPEKF